MDLGRSDGGLPPDEVVEDRDAILAASEAAIDRFHDPAPGAMVRVALAPCSPFSVTPELMAETAQLARRRGVRLHTHLAETLDEEVFCRERFGVRPVQYLEDLGWLGDDVWLAHCVHLSADEVARFGATGTGVAHCPSSNARLGAGIAPVVDLTRAGAPVGLGVDGAASNESGALAVELRQALLVARLAGGPAAMTAREALALATIEGARCLGRDDELGSLEPGKLADVALWRLDGLDHAGIEDPVAALVLGAPRPVDLLLVGGRAVVESAELRTADVDEIARRHRAPEPAAARPRGGRGVTVIPETPVRERREIQRPNRVGITTTRADGVPKVKGEFEYASDMRMDGMLHGATLRSPHPRADIWGIDIGPALAIPGVHAVLTHDDVPGPQDLRDGGRRPAGAGHQPRALPGRAGGDRRRRPPRDRAPRGRRDRGRLRACSSR